MITVPRKYDAAACALYNGQIAELKRQLEEHLKVTITDDALKHSIALYNKFRALMHRLYELRKLKCPPVSGADVMEVANAGCRMPKEMFNNYLEMLLDQLAQPSKQHEGRARIMLAGSVMTNPQFISSIEEVGAVVVADELCTTTRHWSDPVVLDGSAKPVDALSRRYLTNFPCARMIPSDERFRRIIDYIRTCKVDGVISQTIRYCVPYAQDLPLLIEKLKSEGIPVLALDLEYGSSGSGQIRTRVQAFIEMLEAKKK
jgi:benzoyl-CoA reductase/2-hydroxyglutaryl-CoA dehydratase subunit BcrC/BadD/HgdB